MNFDESVCMNIFCNPGTTLATDRTATEKLKESLTTQMFEKSTEKPMKLEDGTKEDKMKFARITIIVSAFVSFLLISVLVLCLIKKQNGKYEVEQRQAAQENSMPNSNSQ